MRKFSWYTIPKRITELATVYQYAVDRFIPYRIDKSGFGSYIHIKKGTFVVTEDGGWNRCKPNMKGGHRHNHIRNAHMRMRKCHICDDPIVWGCEVISDWTNAEFMCRECCRNDAEEYCSAVGIHFGGVTFQTRRKKK